MKRVREGAGVMGLPRGKVKGQDTSPFSDLNVLYSHFKDTGYFLKSSYPYSPVQPCPIHFFSHNTISVNVPRVGLK